MSKRGPLLQFVRGILTDGRTRIAGDEELLQRFLDEHDQTAFEEILRRHGPMVLDVCQSVLRDEATAEDAFQATFLVLAHRAGSIRRMASLSSWLHGVAYRTALKARLESGRRREREGDLPTPQAADQDPVTWAEARRILHEELAALSERHREPLVICYLLGKSQDDAAAILGFSKGTLKRRLERGRALLRERLVRRGLGPTALLLATAWPFAAATASVPTPWVLATATAATKVAGGAMKEAASATVAALTQDVLKIMVPRKIKGLAALILIATAGLSTLTVTILAARMPQPAKAEQLQIQSEQNKGEAPPEIKPDVEKKPVVEQEHPLTRFNPAPTPIVGAKSEVLAIAASADGKRIATIIGNSPNTAPVSVSVIETDSKKQLLSVNASRPFQSIGISPDGKLIAVSGQLGDLKLLEVDSGETIFSKKLDGGAQLAFAPDGQSLATATVGKTVQIWDIPTGEERTKLRGASAPLRCVGFSADGRKLAAGAEQKGSAKNGTVIFVWDMATQRLTQQLESNSPANILSIALSPDGSLLASASSDRQIRIWDVVEAKVKNEWVPPQKLLAALAFSPDRVLAGAMSDGSIRLWHAASGEELAVLKGHIGPCHCLAFLDGGKKLVSGGGARSVKLWDATSKKEIETLQQDERQAGMPVPIALAVASDGSLVALATEDKHVILRDGRTGEVKATLKGHDDAVTCVAFSPDDKTLATGSVDKIIKLWDVATARERATLQGHSNWVYALAFSHDGKTLASGSNDKTVRLWDAGTGKEMGMIEAHRGAVRAVAFSHDDKIIATGGSDRFVKIWDLSTRELKFAIKGHEGPVRALALSGDGKALASGSEDGFVKFWNPATGKELAGAKKEHNEDVTVIAFTSDRLLLSGASDGTIRQWDAATGQMIGALPGHSGGVSGIAVAAGGREFISTGVDRVVKRFRRESFGPIRLFVGHTGVVQSATFSPDGKRIVSCGSWPQGDRTIRIWNASQGTEILNIEHPGQAAAAQFSPDGKFIASASDDSRAYLWNAATGKQVRAFVGHAAGLEHVAFNADGSRLLTCGGYDQSVRVWDTASGQELRKFTGHTDSARRALFHPDGKHVLSAGRDGLVRMWELDTSRELKQFKAPGRWADYLAVSKDGKFVATGGPNLSVYSVDSGKVVSECAGDRFSVTNIVFSDDGKRILSGSYDGVARLWDCATGKELLRLRDHREFLWSTVFSPDGKWILTGGGGRGAGEGVWIKGSDHALRLWRTPDEKAIAEFSPEN